MNDILRPIVLPYRQNIGEAFVFMDNNSCPHCAHVVNDFLQDNDIARLEWPVCSPDMNPIEDAWDRLKRAVYGRFDPPTTLRDIRRIAVEWDNLGQQCLNELVDTGMHQCKRTCYWVLEGLVYMVIWITSESLSV